MSTQIDTRGQLERAYDETETAYAAAEQAYAATDDESEDEARAWTDLQAAEAARDAARDAYAESDEPRYYDLRDGGGGRETIYCCPSEVEQEWEEWMSRGEWGDRTDTSWVRGSATDTLSGESHSYTYTIEAEEPECVDRQDHDWRSPYSVLGGLKENPGVFGHGGGVECHYVCANCGTYRVTDSWAQDPTTGEQGLDAVSYREADEASEAWLWRRLANRVEAVDPPDGYTIRREDDERELRLVRNTDDTVVSLSDDEMRQVVESESWDAIIEQMTHEE